MLIHERYLRREVVLATLLVLASFLGLFGFFDLINELDNLGRGNYGLQMRVTYECSPQGTGSRFTRSMEYRFDHLFGRLANRLFLHRRLQQDSADLLKHLGIVAEHVIPSAGTASMNGLQAGGTRVR